MRWGWGKGDTVPFPIPLPHPLQKGPRSKFLIGEEAHFLVIPFIRKCTHLPQPRMSASSGSV